MSVFTVVERAALQNLLSNYALGELLDYQGIEAGIENTNYFVNAGTTACVLTLFETTPDNEVEYFLELMAHLAARGIACPTPLADRDGAFLQRLHDKPAALVTRLPGASVTHPEHAQLSAIGAAMARMHHAVADFPARRASARGPDWRQLIADELAPYLAADQRALLDEVISEDDFEVNTSLPRGVIHADLFRDNALFSGERLTGIIDFYYAHDGPLIYDLAVTVADWCFIAPNAFDLDGARALCHAYAGLRTVTAAERAAWSAAFRAAGARFWLSRLNDAHFPRRGVLTHYKDPQPFRRVIEFGRDFSARLDAVWT